MVDDSVGNADETGKYDRRRICEKKHCKWLRSVQQTSGWPASSDQSGYSGHVRSDFTRTDGEIQSLFCEAGACTGLLVSNENNEINVCSFRAVIALKLITAHQSLIKDY